MDFRRTKIVATLGPPTANARMIGSMAKLGVNVFRLNMSHGDRQWHREAIRLLNGIRKKGHDIGIMMDIMGPQVRTGDVREPIMLKKGDNLILHSGGLTDVSRNIISVNYDHFASSVKAGSVLYIDNGLLKLRVIARKAHEVTCECLNGCTLTSRRHVNLPGISLKLPFLTKKDWEDIRFGVEMGVDFLALSFVRKPTDIHEVKKFLAKKRSPIAVIAKIESHESLGRLPEIVEASDGVMIARGDLGAEVEAADVPLLQRDIIDLCNEKNRPVIVATHILESMILHPTPTRAEVSDLAHAVFQGADAVMLSGETATGLYPLEAVEMMDTVIRRVEADILQQHQAMLHENNTLKEELVESASVMAANIQAKAILVFTHSGNLGRLASRTRPATPIFAFTRTPGVEKKLLLSWGVKSFLYTSKDNPEDKIQKALSILLASRLVRKGDQVVLVSDVLTSGKAYVHSVQVRMI